MSGTGLKTNARSIAREVLGHRRLFESEFFSVYPYMFDPAQLRFLMDCVTRTAPVTGSVLEVGCARGGTTAMLNKWMAVSGITKRYIAIDTFSGFPSDQVHHEIVNRHKPEKIKWAFAENKRIWVERSLRLCGVTDVELTQADAAQFDYASVRPISFCLLDVDLYIPVLAALKGIYNNLAPGGIIVVDDCMQDERWDGALQAYVEFTQSQSLPKNIVCQKLGVIEKN